MSSVEEPAYRVLVDDITQTPTETVEINYSSIEWTQVHTSVSDFTIETAYNAEEFSHLADVFAPLRIESPTRTLFRGRIENVSGEDSGGTTISGVGRGWYLQRDEENVTYRNTLVSDAIRDYITQYTPFDPDVTTERGTPVRVNDVVQQYRADPAIAQKYFSPDPTQPFHFGPYGIALAPTCFTREAEHYRAATTAHIANQDSFSGGKGVRIDTPGQRYEYTFRLYHEIPSIFVGLPIRFRNTTNTHAVKIIIEVNGSRYQVGKVGAGRTISSLDWYHVIENIHTFIDLPGYDGPNIAPDKTVRVIFEGDTDGGGVTTIDLFALRDTRYTATFDNTVHKPGGALDGPGYYSTAEVWSNRVTFDGRVTDGRVDIRTNTSYRNAQTPIPEEFRLKLSNTMQETEHSTGGEHSHRVNFASRGDDGGTLEAGLRMTGAPKRGGAGANPRDRTPRYNYAGPEVATYELAAWTTTDAVIVEDTFDGSDLDNLRELCLRGNYRFNIPTALDGLHIDAFPTGYGDFPGSFVTDKRKVVNDNRSYGNIAIVNGAEKPEIERTGPNDIRYRAREVSQDDINRLMNLGLSRGEAELPIVIDDPTLETQEAVDARAMALLGEILAAREISGTITTKPTTLGIGVGFDRPEFEGIVLSERADTKISHRKQETTIDFVDPDTLPKRMAVLRRDLRARRGE